MIPQSLFAVLVTGTLGILAFVAVCLWADWVVTAAPLWFFVVNAYVGTHLVTMMPLLGMMTLYFVLRKIYIEPPLLEVWLLAYVVVLPSLVSLYMLFAVILPEPHELVPKILAFIGGITFPFWGYLAIMLLSTFVRIKILGKADSEFTDG